MKIGELAKRAGTTTRQLRYYEEQHLLAPDRTGSNYREYAEEAVTKARQIRCLVEAGMPTRIIRVLLPCVDGPGAELEPQDNPAMAALLLAERDRLQEHIERLKRSHEQIECYLERVQRDVPAGPSTESARD